MNPINQQQKLQQPTLSQPTQSLPQQTKQHYSMTKIVFILLGIIVVLSLISGAYILGTKKTSVSLHQTSYVTPTVVLPSSTITPIKESVLEDTTVPGQKRYTSYKLGIRFLFMADNGSAGQIGVKEVGDTIYVYPYPDRNDYTTGQYVKVYKKTATDTLAQAIRKQLLSKFSDRCFVEIPAFRIGNIYPKSYQTASIWYKNADGTDASFSPGQEPSAPEAKTDCDMSLMPIDGMEYFLEDTSHPDTFVFFSIGQYGINADNTKSWQDTIEFL